LARATDLDEMIMNVRNPSGEQIINRQRAARDLNLAIVEDDVARGDRG
jgi:hypothetical protein